jgi:hypothetical protein
MKLTSRTTSKTRRWGSPHCPETADCQGWLNPYWSLGIAFLFYERGNGNPGREMSSQHHTALTSGNSFTLPGGHSFAWEQRLQRSAQGLSRAETSEDWRKVLVAIVLS